MTRNAFRLFVLFVSCTLAWGLVPLHRAAYATEGEQSPAIEEAFEQLDGTQDEKTLESKPNVSTEEATDSKSEALTEEALEPQANAPAQGDDIDAIVANMTLDERISQMIIVAMRTWDTNNVTDLSAAPELGAALKKHQYGGVIIFGQNVTDNEQTANLVQQLQANNQIPGVSRQIPYFMALDEEGGIVTRLSGGTRMTGSMAIGATGESGEQNAQLTGSIIGSEVKALGFNVNFAPSLDVNNNPSNPTIGTRSFSDDPNTVASLGTAWIAGHAESGAIATLKHFPGHGDTGTDTHFDTASVDKTYEQLNACELVPFRANVSNADMIMTAHITLPLYDDPQVFADGSMGYYPATMSHKVITDLLRNDLGYDGVVVTDALEMDAITQLRAAVGGADQVAQDANIAEKIINAGCDILLIPADLKDSDAAAFYDSYIAAIAAKVKTAQNANGTIEESRINESVRRILQLKQKYGFLDEATPKGNVDSVGSAEHHEQEMQIAREAITLVKNDAYTLPATARNTKVVLIGRTQGDNVALEYAVKELQEEGIMPENAYVNNLAAGTTRGDVSSDTKVTIDYSYDTSDSKDLKAHYTDDLKAAIAEADLVVCVAKTYALSALKAGAPQYEAVHGPLEGAHAAGARFVFVSDNLPYDVARYQDADAILVAYMGTGTDIDPTTRQDGFANVGAFNANLVAAVEAVFSNAPPTGTLPVTVPVIAEAEDGTLSYADEVLYERGFGLRYADSIVGELPVSYAAHVQGVGWMDYVGSTDGDAIAGTVGESRRIEALRIRLDDAPLEGSIEYRAHVQDVGWMDYVGSDEVAGTEGQSRRIEAVQVRLTGEMAESYDVWYRVHVQGYGWLGWARNDSPAGTQGLSRRAEAVEVKVLPKGSTAPGQVYGAFVSAKGAAPEQSAEGHLVFGDAHVQGLGWLAPAYDGSAVGTTGASKRLEALRLSLGDEAGAGAVVWRAHVQGTGWEPDWATSADPNTFAGTTGESRRIEAIQIKLEGDAAGKYDVWYRVHSQTFGWLGWATEGQSAGTEGMSKRAEAVQVVLLPEGSDAPGPTENASVTK